MRLLAAIIILTIFACAALASHQRTPFELRIDAANSLNRPHVMMCRPVVITVGPDDPRPITRT